MLLADPRCCGGQESHFFVTFGRVLRDFDHKAGLERPHGLAGYWKREALLEALRALWDRTMAAVVEARPDATLLVEKTPDHATWIPVIDEVLPESKVIHLVRDSRGVCASLLAASRESWGERWAPRSASDAAKRWVDHVGAAERDGAALGAARFLRVRYEDLHGDAVKELRRVWSFAGLDVDDDALAGIAEQARGDRRPIPTAGELNGVAAEPDGFFRDGSVDGWRGELSAWQRGLVWRRTASLMRDLGYER